MPRLNAVGEFRQREHALNDVISDFHAHIIAPCRPVERPVEAQPSHSLAHEVGPERGLNL